MPDRFKKDSQALQDELCLHYFPDIPVANESSKTECRPSSTSGFQRIYLQNMDAEPSCSDDLRPAHAEEKPKGQDGLPVDEIESNAFQAGFKEGEKAGFEAGTKRIDPLITGFRQGLEQLKDIHRQIHRTIEKEVVQLALSIARKIVCHEVRTDAETVVCVAREALSRVENPGKITIKMNPSDLQFIQDTKSQLSQFIQDVGDISFEAEDSIQSGGCLIETDMGDIDARIEKQFQAIEESFQIEFDHPDQEK